MKTRLVVTTVACLIWVDALAYKTVTHNAIAIKAYEGSVLNDAEFLRGIGINNKEIQYQNSKGDRGVIKELIGFGAEYEDDVALSRACHHFYDPYKDRPLIYALCPDARKSPDFILEDGFHEERFSYREAREHFYKAITEPTRAARDRSYGLMFQNLGHVVHHIQDMAQPQHVRNDAHPPWAASHYEQETAKRVQTAAHLNVFGAYPAVTFRHPRDFWHHPHFQTGIANFTNRNFVSKGSNFVGSPDTGITTGEYPEPAPLPEINTERIQDLLPVRGALLCAGLRLDPRFLSHPEFDCAIDFIQTDVTDHYQGGLVVRNPRASSHSVFNQYLKGFNKTISVGPVQPIDNIFTLNEFNFATARPFLLSRAVAYSTGLIDYFFRGKIEISLPDDGVYGYVDHAEVNQPNQGFTRIKVKLRNATPDLGVTPQEMSLGELHAVAKYRTNPCYRPDLSGEVGEHTELGVYRFPDGCSETDYYGTPEQVAVSEPRPVFAGAPISRTTGTDYEFEFNRDVIPINARDLVLQIVYRGRLGEEQDAVVVSTLDISEPTYISVVNYTDFFHIDGTFYTPDEIRGDPVLRDRMDTNDDGVVDNRDEYPIDPISFEQMRIDLAGTTVTGDFSLPAGGHIRLAMLGKTEDKATGLLHWYRQSTGSMQSRQMNIPPLLNHGDPSSGPRLAAIRWHRGMYAWYLFFMTNGIGAAPAPPEYDRMRDRLLMSANPQPVPLLGH